MKKIITFLVLVFCVANSFGQKEDYKTKFNRIKKAADKGDAVAQDSIGYLYFSIEAEKKDHEKNIRKAFEYFIKSSNQGNTDGTYDYFSLGSAYNDIYNFGVDRNGFSVSFYDIKRRLFENPNCRKCRLEEALAYVDKGRLPIALKRASDLLLENAKKDNYINYRIAKMYATGLGVPQNHTKAVEYYLKVNEENTVTSDQILLLRFHELYIIKYAKEELENELIAIQEAKKILEYKTIAAKNGDVNAQEFLGLAYFKGINTEIDNKQAIEYLTKAVAKNLKESQYNLGLAYLYGIGVKQDQTKAVELITKAAQQGFTDAQLTIGFMYFNGSDGVKIDRVKGGDYLVKACNFGIYGDDLKNELSYETFYVDKFKEIEKLAKDNPNNANAQLDLAICYNTGYGVTPKPDLAQKSYEAAYVLGDNRACERLGDFYSATNPSLAIEYYTKTANLGFSHSNLNLGLYYLYGVGFTKDVAKGVQLIEKAIAIDGNPNAKYYLGYNVYFKGDGVAKNIEKAYGLMNESKNQTNLYNGDQFREVENFYNFPKAEKAASLGGAKEICALGKLYSDGTGCKQDLNKATELFKQAESKGSIDAGLEIVRLNSATPEALIILNKYEKIINNLTQEQARLVNSFIGTNYYYGTGVAKDYNKAFPYLLKGHKKYADFSPDIEIAHCYYEGLGVERNPDYAVDFVGYGKFDSSDSQYAFKSKVYNEWLNKRSQEMDTCPVCKGTGVTYTQESYTYTTQEDAYKRETVLVYDSSSNFSKVENREKTYAKNNTGTKDVQHTCSRCNGSGKVHKY